MERKTRISKASGPRRVMAAFICPKSVRALWPRLKVAAERFTGTSRASALQLHHCPAVGDIHHSPMFAQRCLRHRADQQHLPMAEPDAARLRLAGAAVRRGPGDPMRLFQRRAHGVCVKCRQGGQRPRQAFLHRETANAERQKTRARTCLVQISHATAPLLDPQRRGRRFPPLFPPCADHRPAGSRRPSAQARL